MIYKIVKEKDIYNGYIGNLYNCSQVSVTLDINKFNIKKTYNWEEVISYEKN